MASTPNLGVFVLVSLAACSHDVATGRRCDPVSAACSANERDAGQKSADYGNSKRASADSGSLAAPEAGLSVQIEDIQKISIELVTIACNTDCADVVAVAHGGHGPYSFAWDDGAEGAARHLCPQASTRYAVTANDTALDSGEFHYDAHSATAQLSARVLDCHDAGGPSIPRTCDRVTDHFVTDAPSKNPVDQWSYGYTPALGGEFRPYPTFAAAMPPTGTMLNTKIYPDIAQWYDDAVGAIPDAMFNAGASPVHPAEVNFGGDAFTVAANQLALEPGAMGEYSVARWTAPSTGTYIVTGAFLGLCGDNGLPLSTVDVHVQHNGTDLGSGYINLMAGGNSTTVVQRVTISVGDTIDFAVGPGDGLAIYDFTALDATICQVQ